jgi:hypothetical protein
MEAPVKTYPVEQAVDVGSCVKSDTSPFGPEQPEQLAEQPAVQPAENPAEPPKTAAPSVKPELNPSDIRFWGGLLAEHQAQQRAARSAKYSSLFKM